MIVIILFVIVAWFFFKQGKRTEAFKRDSAVVAVPVSGFEKAELGGGEREARGGTEEEGGGNEFGVNRARLSELDGMPVQKPVELPDSRE